ncbi:glutamine amidotransferase [Parvibaculum sp.]|uniref:glutamine amidotransferase n=1 Tax=Parvibaculum sp. TaxID=2024848 RepID=UPI00391D266B
MGRRILIVLHQERSSPGRVGQALIRRGCELDIRRPALGDPLPDDMSGHEAAVIFGGPMSANDELPFIKAETAWIGVPLKEEKPFLGICLGGQMMARHLGARVYSPADERVEAGYYPIRPTAEGRHLFDDPQHVYQWHQQGFDLPSGAVQLAEGTDFPVQAMRYGKAAYGLQFHPELTTPMMEAWLEFGKERLSRPGAQPAELHYQGRAQHDATLRAWLDRFLDQWLPHENETEIKAETA